MTAKKCTKKRDACAKLSFCLSKPIAFIAVLVASPSPSLLLKLPNMQQMSSKQPKDRASDR